VAIATFRGNLKFFRKTRGKFMAEPFFVAFSWQIKNYAMAKTWQHQKQKYKKYKI
jgi:hypothetical protein